MIFRIFVPVTKRTDMKYNELERLVRKAGCYDTKRQQAGHPLWYSPKTGENLSDEQSRKRRSSLRNLTENQTGSGYLTPASLTI